MGKGALEADNGGFCAVTGKLEKVKAALSPPHSKKVRLLAGLEPDDVVRAVEGYEHQAFFFGRAGKPVRRLAGHHGEPAGTEHGVLHPFHSGGDVPFYDDELLL